MLTLNGVKFAKDDNEFVNSLFNNTNTCVGYYKINKKSITLFNMQKIKIGVITCNGILAHASKIDDQWWYSYATIKEIGRFPSYSEERREILKALEENNIQYIYN